MRPAPSTIKSTGVVSCLLRSLINKSQANFIKSRQKTSKHFSGHRFDGNVKIRIFIPDLLPPHRASPDRSLFLARIGACSDSPFVFKLHRFRPVTSRHIAKVFLYSTPARSSFLRLVGRAVFNLIRKRWNNTHTPLSEYLTPSICSIKLPASESEPAPNSLK